MKRRIMRSDRGELYERIIIVSATFQGYGVVR